MAEFKLNISDPSSGKSAKRELSAEEARMLIGKKLGDKIAGDSIGLEGYEFQITGGSDYCGFPMRKDVPSAARKRVLITKSVGLKKAGKEKIRKGMRKRRTLAGNTIYPRTSQINLKILKKGKEALFAKTEEKQEEQADKAQEQAEQKTDAKPQSPETAKQEKTQEKKQAQKAAKPKTEPAGKQEEKEDKPEPKK
jgi:small subunit ribosomal protein S6e